jgi:hypothetical protein
MALVKFVHLLAVLSFAIFQVSFVPLPANALAVERGHVGRDHVHAGIIKRQSGSSKRCKPRKGNDKPPTYPNNNSTTHDNTSHPTTTSITTTSPHQTPTSTPSRGSKRILSWSNSVESSLKNFIGPNSDILCACSLSLLCPYSVSFSSITRWALEPYSSNALGVSYDLFQKSKYLPQLWGHPEDLQYSKTLRTGEIVYPFIATFNEWVFSNHRHPKSLLTYPTDPIKMARVICNPRTLSRCGSNTCNPLRNTLNLIPLRSQATQSNG